VNDSQQVLEAVFKEVAIRLVVLIVSAFIARRVFVSYQGGRVAKDFFCPV
jgi:hypothetical protein